VLPLMRARATVPPSRTRGALSCHASCEISSRWDRGTCNPHPYYFHFARFVSFFPRSLIPYCWGRDGAPFLFDVSLILPSRAGT
jgi:hypothetical protein